LLFIFAAEAVVAVCAVSVSFLAMAVVLVCLVLVASLLVSDATVVLSATSLFEWSFVTAVVFLSVGSAALPVLVTVLLAAVVFFISGMLVVLG